MHRLVEELVKSKNDNKVVSGSDYRKETESPTRQMTITVVKMQTKDLSKT